MNMAYTYLQNCIIFIREISSHCPGILTPPPPPALLSVQLSFLSSIPLYTSVVRGCLLHLISGSGLQHCLLDFLKLFFAQILGPNTSWMNEAKQIWPDATSGKSRWQGTEVYCKELRLSLQCPGETESCQQPL